MSTDRQMLSPARRAQRCRRILIALALIGTAASMLSELILANIFRSSSPDGEDLIYTAQLLSDEAASVSHFSISRISSNTSASDSSAESEVSKWQR